MFGIPVEWLLFLVAFGVMGDFVLANVLNGIMGSQGFGIIGNMILLACGFGLGFIAIEYFRLHGLRIEETTVLTLGSAFGVLFVMAAFKRFILKI